MDILVRLRAQKPFAALLVVVATMFALAACGGTGATATAANVPGVSNNAITIGAILEPQVRSKSSARLF